MRRWHQGPDASDKSRVLEALGKAASEIRTKFGESLSSVQKFDTPLEQATTPSLEALQAYSFGWKTQGGGDSVEAIPFFERAIKLDPNFAMAYARLGVSYSFLGENTLASENLGKAYELRDHVSEREKLEIESEYHIYGMGDYEKAQQSLKVWAQTFRRDFVPRLELGNYYFTFGQYDKSLPEYRESLRLSPETGQLYALLAYTYLALNRLEEARATVDGGKGKRN